MKLLIVQVAALSSPIDIPDFKFTETQSVFPAVTCTVQASFKTASYPESHGMVANGYMFRNLQKPLFWEQSSQLVAGERIWQEFRSKGKKVGMLFWQQSLGEDVDILLSPAPIHKHHGGMIMDCYSQPQGLYRELCQKLGRSFSLMKYWGPMASATVGNWIVDATLQTLKEPTLAPDLCFTYIPSLDYDLQRYPSDHPKCKKATNVLQQQLSKLLSQARKMDYEVVVFGDYHISHVSKAVSPNLILKDSGYFKPRHINRMEYPDFHASKAFAVVDHEIAHVYIKNSETIETLKNLFSQNPAIAKCLTQTDMEALHLSHPNCGELLLVAADDHWFAYPWWTNKKQAPDYASHIDIHNKPGYDPCELFSGRIPIFSVSQDTSKIQGSHGNIGMGREVVWGSTLDFAKTPSDLVELAAAVKQHLTKS